MATNAPVWYNIYDGPDVDELLESLKRAFSRKKLWVIFKIRSERSISYSSPPPRPIDAIITCMRYESGASGLFILEMNVEGYIKAGGYYNANDKTGHFHMTPRR